MKTIALIASCDTKMQEVTYMKEKLKEQGARALVADMSIGPRDVRGADISREEVLSDSGYDWNAICSRPKGELMGLMAEAMRGEILSLYDAGEIDAVLAAGGVQNTTVATRAMRALPLGFPKVMVTTIASGRKHFEDVVGDKDIIVFPSIVDFTGLNEVIRTVLSNACTCAAALAGQGIRELKKRTKPVIGITMMGITDKGCSAAVRELEVRGFEVYGFHATGAGGARMEQMAENGLLDGILDMTPHELVAEYFGGGFSYGTHKRLQYLKHVRIPTVIAPGGLDFIDYDVEEFPYSLKERRYNKHNERLAHIKLTAKEAYQVAKLFAGRLNEAEGDIQLILPTDGMRRDTKPGESLYDPEIDTILAEGIKSEIKKEIQVKVVEGNLDTEGWGRQIAAIMANELQKEEC